jgi:transposase
MRLKVAKLKAKLRDIRQDFLHKLSTKVINENQSYRPRRFKRLRTPEEPQIIQSNQIRWMAGIQNNV